VKNKGGGEFNIKTSHKVLLSLLLLLEKSVAAVDLVCPQQFNIKDKS